ncbi:Cell wall-associated hydrolase, NlpC family [Nocardia amikacinitolerans]|uniref:Cell wall-associated hydrolase, NlpC family n=1 Tax=Nocardia amikacinitolerans TaxID=756689 RepID=A0A285LP79_9NOCA|nr:C40 family peptidase [Nocardia amikacinitolerans]MCP2278848.1 Cell wall-associated hydrolase, NlpC family [Nocardia amikacinitolerans]MCP2290581.1 Cell wall-associated hydrolase, NlpC family [Nocardia amikacinitolerans]MCP2299699.1 Cell wall-associated hydrolase, NlpC family [Nocardia amikacinitolerans]SNY86708.1 Cell wall-associated hydrolase, NlpC family [Nocardia amikacinitolerans]
MATNTVKRQAQRAVAAGAVGAATIGAFLLPAAPASAQPVTIPGVGTFEVPNEIPIPADIPGVQFGTPPGGAPLPFVAPQKTLGEVALDAAMSKLGSPYVYGAAGPNAFDCSGLVQWSYRQAGMELPRTSGAQLASGTPVSLDDLQPGDLVSFYGGGHSGLYAGDGNVIHASTSGTPVMIASMDSMPIAGARRF